jgi:hypothetical protein
MFFRFFYLVCGAMVGLPPSAFPAFLYSLLFSLYSFWRDFKKMTDRKVNFVRLPTEFEYGTVAVFEDLYGNLCDLIEPNENGNGLIIVASCRLLRYRDI